MLFLRLTWTHVRHWKTDDAKRKIPIEVAGLLANFRYDENVVLFFLFNLLYFQNFFIILFCMFERNDEKRNFRLIFPKK